jgi:site-specific DNA recombinase
MTMSEPQAAIYARVSSEQQAEAGTIGSQLAAPRARVAADGLALPPERQFVDDGYSGATRIRPALERLRDLAAAGGLDRLYVQAPDRLARKYAYRVLLLDELRRVGVAVVFLNRAVGQSPEDELLLQVQGVVAEYERAKILERSRRGKRHAAQHGEVSVLSGAPYGYRYVSKAAGGGAARFEIVLEEARLVRQVLTWVGHERLTLAEACRRLTAAGVPTRTGRATWNRTTVWEMLKNPAYIGRAAYGRTREAPYAPRGLRPARGRPAQPRAATTTTDVPAADWLSVPVPPLVDEALFAAVQEQLAENRRRHRQQQRGARYLLQGLVVCAECGYAYYGKAVSPSSANAAGQRYAYYRCTGADAHRFGGVRACGNTQVRTDRLEAAVWRAVQDLLEQPARVAEEYRRRVARPAPRADEVSGVEEQVTKLRAGLGRLIDSYADGLIDKGEFEPRLARLRERIGRLEEQARQLRDEERARRELRLVVGQVEAFAAEVRVGLEEADWPTCREVIRAVVRRVDIERGRVRVVFRVPPVPLVGSPATGILLDCREGDRRPIGGDADHRAPAAQLLVQPLQRVGRVDLAPVLAREVVEGQDLALRLLQQRHDLREALGQGGAHLAQLRPRRLVVGLLEDGAHRRRHHRPGALGHVRDCVPDGMHPASLPAGADDHLADGLLEAAVGVADHQPHAARPAGDQPLQEGAPDGGVLARADVQPQHLAHPVLAHAVGDHHRHRLHPVLPAHVLVARVEPHVGVRGVQPPAAEGRDLLIEAGAQPADLALADADDARGLDQRLDPPRAHPLDVGRRHHGDQRLLRAPARLQPAREVAAGARLGDGQVERADPRVPSPRAVAVAVGPPLARPLVAGRADLGADLGLHQFLHRPADQLAREVRLDVLPLAQRLHGCHRVGGHRVRLPGGLSLPLGTRTMAAS